MRISLNIIQRFGTHRWPCQSSSQRGFPWEKVWRKCGESVAAGWDSRRGDGGKTMEGTIPPSLPPSLRPSNEIHVDPSLPLSLTPSMPMKAN